MPAKNALTAAALALVFPGAGHLYLGHPKRALIPLLSVIVSTLLLAYFGYLSSAWGFAFYIFSLVALTLFGTIDSARLGWRKGRSDIKWYMRWYSQVIWLLCISVLAHFWLATRETVLGYGVFKVPGMSMSPTVVSGDRVLVNTRAQTIESLPLRSVVVVKHPRRGGEYMRRVVAKADGGMLSLASDSPSGPEVDTDFQAVPVSSVSGVVTTVLWSPLHDEFMQSVE
jgi:TM2 domain-containing membrane protein YozV